MNKFSLTLILLFFLAQNGFSQILKNVNLNLNAGGEVYDVTYISNIKKYIAVGNFTTINGVSRNNIAFLNEDFSVNGGTIPAVNGKVYCVEFVGSSVVIGGNFSTFNATASQSIARFTVSVPTPYTITGNVTVTPIVWNPLINSGWAPTEVHDLEKNGSQIIAVGSFDTWRTNAGADSVRNCIASFSIGTGNLSLTAFNSNNGITNFGPSYSGEFNRPLIIKKTSDGFLVAGALLCTDYYCGSTNYNKEFLIKYNNSGVVLTGNTQPIYGGFQFDGGYRSNSVELLNYNDSTAFTMNLSFHNFAMNSINHFTGEKDSLLYYNNYIPLVNGTPVSPAIYDFEKWNNNIYTIKYDGNLPAGTVEELRKDEVFKSNGVYGLNLLDSTFVDFTTDMGPDSDLRKPLHVVNNYLFISAPSLTNVDGTAKSRFAVLCLEPENAQAMNNQYNLAAPVGQPQPYELDTVVCSGNIKRFTVPPALYASGYKWSFTGSGVNYAFGSALNTQPSIISNSFGAAVFASSGTYSAPHQIWLEFDENFSGGVLKVEPYSTCNSGTDYQLSKGTQVQLILAPMPNIQIPTDTGFSCLMDSVTLQVSSSTANVNTTWYDINGNATNSTSLTLLDTDISDTTYFLASVTETSGNMCRSVDSTKVFKDINYPELDYLPSTQYIWNCLTDSLTVEIQDTNTFYTASTALIQSSSSASGPFTGNNPVTVYNPNDVFFTAIYPTNGCSASFTVQITSDLTPPDVSVVQQQNGITVVDTVNCIHDSTLLTLTSSTAGASVYWIYQNTHIPDSLWVGLNDPYYPLADTSNTSVVNVTYYYGATNPSNGCFTPLPIPVGIAFDTQLPVFIPFSGDSIMTCSEDSLLLVHDVVLAVASQGWVDNDGNFANDTLIQTTVFSPTLLHYQITGTNGCKVYDTVQTLQTNELLFQPITDFWVCPQENFQVSAQAVGQGSFNYSWSTGTFGASTSGIGGMDTLLVVTATNAQNCLGKDTVLVRITEPITATFTGFSACGSGGFIQVDSIYGGAVANNTQYLYAFNGGAFSSVNNFQVDSFATYPLQIKDTLDCVYSFNATISGTIQNPSCNFLAATYNLVGDTVFIVDITQFQGFDSVNWSSPNGVTFIATATNNTLVTVSDSGWVKIVYTGYIYDTVTSPFHIDTCIYPFSKWIYFGDFGANLDTSEVIHGISNPSVYPNPTADGGATIHVTFELGVTQDYYCFTTNTLGDNIPSLSFSGSGQGPVDQTLVLPNLAPGTYLIHLLSEYGARQLKLTVQ